MADTFETWLYKKCRALYVSPLSRLATRLNLLDILIKVNEGGPFSSPHLFRAGSILDLGTESSKETQDMLQNRLKGFWEGKGSMDETFFWSYGEVPVFSTVLSSKSSVVSSLLAGVAEASLEFSRASELKLEIIELDTACAKWEVLGRMMSSKPPTWKLDVDDFRLKPVRPVSGRSTLDLWVVNEILYAKTVVIKSADSSSGSGKVCHIVPGNLPTAGTSAGIDVKRTREITNGLELSAAEGKSPASKVPEKSMIAFRLVGFVFNSAGEFIGYKEDPGAVLPVVRGSEDEQSHSDQRGQIHDLYMETAPVYDSDVDDDEDDDAETRKTWNLQRLPIVDTDGDLDVPFEGV